ncbi:hypothetical protein EDC01DRAFT_528497 [Geopyxis carbonaria]|nr:hypothetical protein EDC01DRAFT_528497 [Geopyxis carbonaria]
MTRSAATLSLPSSTGGLSRSPSPVTNRQPSRSPQPYRRRQSSRKYPGDLNTKASLTNTPSPGTSRAPTPFRGGSESGTEADDELTKRLPAPLGWKCSSDEDEGAENKRGRRNKRGNITDQRAEKRKTLMMALVRRMIEIGLVGVLVVIVLVGKEARAWSEVLLRRKEMLYWSIPYFAIILAYPSRILLRGARLRLPSSLDPSPLLYPTLFPIIVALSLTPTNRESTNPYLLTNLVISLTNLPPILISSWDLRWIYSFFPLIPTSVSPLFSPGKDLLSFVAPINMMLTSALTGLLYPSLTASELRLLSSALINLLLHASSPQATILEALMWGGGIGVFVLCEDLIKWNINLARVPLHRFRHIGHTVVGMGRIQKLANMRVIGWRGTKQASDSEADIPEFRNIARKVRKKSFFATLSREEARVRKIGYSTAVYITVLAIVFLGLRPYIGNVALDGMDPFVWAPSYMLCGQEWYQKLVDYNSPGIGYCVTEGSTGAANLRLHIIGYWIIVITVGLCIVTTLASRVEVDTRRKIFHGMIIPMFLIPGLFDPPFVHLCLSVALSLFILVDLVRAGQLPPASGWIARFLQPYVDGRDLKGPMVVSHVFLLVGTGIGWWLTLAGNPLEGWDYQGEPELSFVSGVACVGFGDAAASLIGRRFGKTKWGWRGGKSVEGSLAFTVALMIGLCIPRLWIKGIRDNWGIDAWIKLLIAGIWGSMVEAVATGINDNVVVPIGIWAVVRGLGL